MRATASRSSTISTPRRRSRSSPPRSNTGLFFFRGKPGAPFAIISPGGGFSYVGSIHEGFPYAPEISNKGYNAFVLRYRAGQGGAVATAGSGCRHLVHFPQRRDAWRRHRQLFPVGQLGGRKDGGRDRLARRRSVRRRRSSKAVSRRDGLYGAFGLFVRMNRRPSWSSASTTASLLHPRWKGGSRRCAQAGTEVEYHRYRNLGHGFGPGTGTSAEGWIADAISFWSKFARSN